MATGLPTKVEDSKRSVKMHNQICPSIRSPKKNSDWPGERICQCRKYLNPRKKLCPCCWYITYYFLKNISHNNVAIQIMINAVLAILSRINLSIHWTQPQVQHRHRQTWRLSWPIRRWTDTVGKIPLSHLTKSKTNPL